MKKVSKRNLILEAIIQEYLHSGEPIGSNELQMKMDIEISPSTIRIYLKRLSEEGALNQLHVSSGRVPTNQALIDYWKEKLHPEDTLSISSLDNLQEQCKEHELFCIVEKTNRETFKELVEVSGRFLVLVFDSNEVVLKYSEQVQKFLSNLIGCEMRDLKNISAQVGLYELHDKLHQILSHSYVLKEGEDRVYEIARQIGNENFLSSMLNSQFSFGLKEGLYFDNFVPEGCLALKQSALVGDDDAALFCFGKIDSDFESFLRKTRS